MRWLAPGFFGEGPFVRTTRLPSRPWSPDPLLDVGIPVIGMFRLMHRMTPEENWRRWQVPPGSRPRRSTRADGIATILRTVAPLRVGTKTAAGDTYWRLASTPRAMRGRTEPAFEVHSLKQVFDGRGGTMGLGSRCDLAEHCHCLTGYFPIADSRRA